jgi:hypothetical protein
MLRALDDSSQHLHDRSKCKVRNYEHNESQDHGSDHGALQLGNAKSYVIFSCKNLRLDTHYVGVCLFDCKFEHGTRYSAYADLDSVENLLYFVSRCG